MGLEITNNFIVAMETFTFPINTIIQNLTAQGTKQVSNIKKAEIQINTSTYCSRSCPSSMMAQMAHVSFLYYFPIPKSEFRVPKFALRTSEW